MLQRRFSYVLIVAAFAFAARAQNVSATIDGSKTGDPISKYLYGQFIEHLGDPITKGLWAEMIDDRKFFFPVNSRNEEPPPPLGQVPARGNGRRNRWKPIGPDSFVVMDREHPYVGDQTPLIKLDAAAAHGIQQAGLALRKGKAYTGRVVLAGDADAKVSVAVVWGPNPGDRFNVPVGAMKSDYAKVPIQFTARADSDDARIEISGTGRGGFHIGAVSLMPADNLKGFRPDSIALLKSLKSGMYRYPGGNYISNFDWEDAIGDPDKRPPRWDYHWGVMQPNDVGDDEFVVLCQLIDVDPYITVNSGFGDVRSGANQVEYLNGSTDTPYGKLRAANGHAAPYNVKYFNIGNEMYGWWQLGHMALNQYTFKHNMMAKEMRRKDPGITIIASGAMPDEMTVTTNARRTTGKVLAEFGTESDWTGGMLTNSIDFFGMLAEHWYTHAGMRFDLETGQNGKLGTRAGFIEVEESFIDSARRGANRMRSKAESWEEYVRRFPAIKDRKITVAMDEWSCGLGPGMRTNLSTAWAFHEMFRHTDFIKMSAHTMGYSCINYTRTDARLNSLGQLFQYYRDHYGTIPVEVSGNSPQPPPKWPVGGDQPKVNAGSPTYPLDVAAAWTTDRKALTFAVINPDDRPHALALQFEGVEFTGKGKMWRMTGPNVPPAQPGGRGGGGAVNIAETAVGLTPQSVAVPPMSISLYELSTR